MKKRFIEIGFKEVWVVWEVWSLVVQALDSESKDPCSKLLGGSKFNSAFHPSKVDQMNGNVVVKSKLPPRIGSVALRELNLIHKQVP